MTDDIDFKKIYREIHSILEVVTDFIDPNSMKSVRHFLDHGEPEMAVERLFLDLMMADNLPSDIDRVSWIPLAREMKLNEDTVLDGDFWENFVVFAETGTLRN